MLQAVKLRTEYLVNPLGLDIRHPCVSWNLEGESKRASAYEIRASHSGDFSGQDPELWNSGKITSSSMVQIPLRLELHSRERVYWQVRIWDEADQTGPWSETAFFEMGLLKPEEWQAAWISGDYMPEEGIRYPVDEFRKCFSLPVDKQARIKARLYITARGLYETHINGKRVGTQILTPGSSSYDSRLHYQTYDVTELLWEGENIWEISLGDGWYRGKMGVFGNTNVYGRETSVLAQLEIWNGENQVACIVTDEGFAWSNDGAIRFNDMKDGEIVEGGRHPSYEGRAKRTEPYAGILCCSNNVTVEEREHFTPTVLQTPDGSTVLDFGQNLAGYVAFSVKGETGHTAYLQMGEMLDENGNFTIDNVIMKDTSESWIPDYCDDSRFQRIDYTCGSSQREYWKPKFCVQGFRYVKLTDWPEEVVPEHFRAIAIYSGLEETMKFSCSVPEIEQLVKNTLWSMKGNFLDVPTDCPTRERAAWLGDAQLFFNTGCYFMDFTAFFRKWMRDVFDDQASDGKLYNIVPRGGVHGGATEYVEGSSGWTDAGILIPYRYWKRYGDIRMLKEYYKPMKALANFLLSRTEYAQTEQSSPEGSLELDQRLEPSEWRQYIVTTGFHFGEWNEPDSSSMSVAEPKYEEATAYLSYSLSCLAEIAEVLGEKQEGLFYKELAEKTKAAYRHYFVKDGRIVSERMCCYVRPLALGLLKEEEARQAGEDLLELVKRKRYHIGTGFLSTPFVLPVLTEAGYTKEAYRMLMQEEYPSWIYEIRQGATTVWENWDGVASRNHYSNGAVCEWIFRTMCGISVDGENHFEIAPRPDRECVTEVTCQYQSLYGAVSCRWKREGLQIFYQIEIPAGCEAIIRLEGQEERKVLAGRYEFCGQ